MNEFSMDDATASVSKVVCQISLLGMNVNFMSHYAVYEKDISYIIRAAQNIHPSLVRCTVEFD